MKKLILYTALPLALTLFAGTCVAGECIGTPATKGCAKVDMSVNPGSQCQAYYGVKDGAPAQCSYNTQTEICSAVYPCTVTPPAE
jgi:hypothetical protein